MKAFVIASIIATILVVMSAAKGKEVIKQQQHASTTQAQMLAEIK